MNRISLLCVASVLAACAGSAACSSNTSTSTADASDAGSGGAAGAPAEGGTTVDGEVTSCPPAPFEDEYAGRPCHDLNCRYATPGEFASDRPLNCPTAMADLAGTCSFGQFQLGMSTISDSMCCPTKPSDVTWCGGPITEGAPCHEPDNSECVLDDESATCACDKPGPIWRCTPIDGGVQYCTCSDNGGCTYAGAEAGLDAGAEAGLDAGPG